MTIRHAMRRKCKLFGRIEMPRGMSLPQSDVLGDDKVLRPSGCDAGSRRGRDGIVVFRMEMPVSTVSRRPDPAGAIGNPRKAPRGPR